MARDEQRRGTEEVAPEDRELERDERVEEQQERRAQTWWERRRVAPEERREVLGQLFFEGEALRRYLYRFAFLMALSVIIATVGLLVDSPAVVIGAMLLAPLITPMLASAAALLMVWPRRVFASALVVAGATVGSVALSWGLSTLVPDAATATLPDEVLSRTTPNVLDLVVALAAGAAGAYALVREELGMALPGVAIAVAVLPPLTAIGVTLDLGDLDMALGAALLYLANGTAIVLAAGVVFVATGFVPSVRLTRMNWRVVVAIVLAAVPVAVLAVPLTLSLEQAVEHARLNKAAGEQVAAWLGHGPAEVQNVAVDNGIVVVDLASPVPPPPAQELARHLSLDVEGDVDVRVRWTVRYVEATAFGGGPQLEGLPSRR